jgi:diguanylate cyclase (GGDEF)-like protein
MTPPAGGSSCAGPVAAAPSGSIAKRMVWATLCFSLLFTAVTAGVRSYFAQRAAKALMESELTQVHKVFSPSLAKAVWEIDRDSMKSHLASAAALASIGRIEVLVLRDGRSPELQELQRPGWQPGEAAPRLVRALTYAPYRGGEEVVGELRLYGDARILTQRIREEVLNIVAVQAVQSVLLALLIAYLFNRSVTVHVKATAEHLSSLTPNTLHRPLQLTRSDRSSDELTVLQKRVNDLQRNLHEYLERQRRDEEELAAHRDRLAELVSEKTRELEDVVKQLHEASRTDPLTGLPNRRCFDEAKELELVRVQRHHRPLSLLLLDVDHFKRYNDAYGHAAGDDCLRAVAQVLQANFRATDVVARVGGEEFAVLLPETTIDQAMVLGERLVERVRQRDIAHRASDIAPCVTISVGAAQFVAETMRDVDVLIQHADAALYRSKNSGRNRVRR